MMMFSGLIGLLEAKTTLEFFFAWELMTAGSYFLIIRGKKSMEHALSYILFSLGGAYLILTGFGLAQVGQSGMSLEILKDVHYYAPHYIHPYGHRLYDQVGFVRTSHLATRGTRRG